MLNEEDLSGAKKLIEAFKPPITFFETDILLPAVVDRLKYIKSIFADFKVLAADREVALHIDAALRNVIDPRLFQMGAPEPQVGQQYLRVISEMIDRDFIGPIDLVLNQADAHPINDIETLTKFLNAAVQVMQTLVGTKDRLFMYSLRTIVNIRNTTTGQIVLGPPDELSIVLVPFQTRLDEMLNVAKTTIESVERWGEQIRDQKKRHIEMIVNLSQVKASEQQARAAKYNMWFQVAVIIFTVVLVLGSQTANLYLEKMDIQGAVEILRSKSQVCEKNQASFGGMADELKTCKSKLDSKMPSTKIQKTKGH